MRLFAGHAAEHLPPETELVVYSDAVPPANPELRRAAELGIPTLSYFQMLGRLGVGRRTVAVAGTHGKSTTAAMLAHLLIEAGCDPTVVYGATPLAHSGGGDTLGRYRRQAPSPTLSGRRDRMAMRCWSKPASIGPISCTFDRSRPPSWASSPTTSTATTRLAQLEDAFRRFAESIPDDGLLVVRHDCHVHTPGDGRACTAASSRSASRPTPIGRPRHGSTEDRGRFRFEIRPVWPPAVRGAIADAGRAQRAERLGRRRAGL